ncbi:MAG: hypothetical protein QXG65_04805 [Thermoplasmata archaeon]
MDGRTEPGAGPRHGRGGSLRVRCACGHLPTHHMRVVPVDAGGNQRLDPSGPCEICGPAICAEFRPRPRPPPYP